MGKGNEAGSMDEEEDAVAVHHDRLRYAPRVGSWLQRLADASTGRVQLLSGEPTSRADTMDTFDAATATPEQVIEMAVQHGLYDRLPAGLLEYAEKHDLVPEDPKA